MKEHDWMKLYADAEKFMKKVGGTDFNIKTNIKTERWGEALVTVNIPKRNNPIAIMRMDANEYCSRYKGFRRDGKLYLTYMLKKLSFAQGKLLIKLVDRQSNQTSYELVKAFMGPFKAGFYQAFAALFGASLKKEYDPEGEDKLTERVVLLVENGQI